MTTETCPCACHVGYQTPCDEPGGCGHRHGERRCYRAEECAEYERVDGERRGARINAETGLCPVCVRVVERAIAELPRDYTELNLILGKGNGGDDVLVAGTRELPTPLRLSIEAIQADMVFTASTWAEVVAARVGVDFSADATRPGWLLDRSARLLEKALSALLAVRDEPVVVWVSGTEFARQRRDGTAAALHLLRLHRDARRYCGLTKVTVRKQVPCPRCQSSSLLWEVGSDTITCSACQKRFALDRFEELCSALAPLWKKLRR